MRIGIKTRPCLNGIGDFHLMAPVVREWRVRRNRDWQRNGKGKWKRKMEKGEWKRKMENENGKGEPLLKIKRAFDMRFERCKNEQN